VTVTYAQSIDGSIATRKKEPLRLSSEESMVLTHHLRANSDAILIGINTLLIDDPQLTVRLVEGRDPRPIILDSSLRTPKGAAILQRAEHRCLLAGTSKNEAERVVELENLGSEVLNCRPDPRGKVDLVDLMRRLGQRGIRSVMVEGGSEVITSFLDSRLVDQLIITLAPRFVGGLPVFRRSMAATGPGIHLEDTTYIQCGPDVIIWARPQWGRR
jgi:3,4-dihydroxy 2-butanone 4-phosphate synthase/GTP cyclohydrolase II